VHSGDTRPDADATFMATAILTKHGGSISSNDFAQNVQRLEAQDFNKNTKQIYQGIVQLKGLQLVKESVTEKYTEKYYNLLMSLTERHSAFRLDSLRSASVSATYYAFQAIKELGKMEQFKQQEEFNSAIHFVASMKDAESGGFRDSMGENATLLATWHAVSVLNEQTSKREIVSKAYEGVAKFVFSCQVLDGGFLDQPAKSVEQRLKGVSTMASTSQALYILSVLEKNGVITLGFFDPLYVHYYDANSYLRSCLSLLHGVVSRFPSKHTDLEATYYFLRLVDDFTGFSYGVPRALQMISAGLGALLVLYAIFLFYSPQIVYNPTRHMRTEFKRAAVFLIAGAVALQYVPALAILVYLVFVIYLVIRFYDVQATDKTDGMMLLLAAVNTFCFLGMVFLLLYTAPHVFAVNLRVFYALAAWSAVCTFGVTVGAVYMTELKQIRFFTDTAYLAWIFNTVLFYSFLYGRGEMDLVYRLMAIQGHLPVIFVVLPLINLVLSYAFSSGAVILYYTTWGRPVKKTKQSKAAPKTPQSLKKSSGTSTPTTSRPPKKDLVESTAKDGEGLEDSEKPE